VNFPYDKYIVPALLFIGLLGDCGISGKIEQVVGLNAREFSINGLMQREKRGVQHIRLVGVVGRVQILRAE
jgi:hypothetical protein